MLDQTQAELGWATGFLEADGCVYTSGGLTRIHIGQVVRARLERFQAAVGGRGRIYGPYERKKGELGKQPYFRYAAGHRHTKKILEILTPFMTDPVKGGE